MEKNIRKKLSNVFEYLKERCVPIGALKRVSWKDLAAIVGKSKSTISDYKLGKINIKVQDTEDIFGAYGYCPNMVALPVEPINGDVDKYYECVKINMILLNKSYQDVVQILEQFGIY